MTIPAYRDPVEPDAIKRNTGDAVLIQAKRGTPRGCWKDPEHYAKVAENIESGSHLKIIGEDAAGSYEVRIRVGLKAVAGGAHRFKPIVVREGDLPPGGFDLFFERHHAAAEPAAEPSAATPSAGVAGLNP